MFPHFGKGKAILGIAIPLDNQIVNDSAFLEESAELDLELFGVGLNERGGTLPSRLVMKSLVAVGRGEGEGERTFAELLLD